MTEYTYHNTLRYTDEFLEKLYDYAQKNLHLQSMLYFSDHGDNLQYGHHPDIRTPDTVRIPMFVWLSEEYMQKFPDKAAALRQHREAYYSNDMMYNTVLGLLDADCDRYDPKEDISSSQYGYNKDTVKTFLGDVLASDYDI